MNRKRKITAAIVAAIALVTLTGCAPASDLDAVVKAKTDCEEAGGMFESWTNDFHWFIWKCDFYEE